MNGLLILARLVHFGACLLLVAVFAVRLLVGRAVAGSAPGRRFAAWCLAAAAGSGFLWLWVSVAGMSGGGLWASLNLQLFQMVLRETPPGQVWLARLGIAALLAIVLCASRARWIWCAGAMLAAMFTGSLAWLGHAGAGEDGRRSLMLGLDIAHILSASLWPAGLLPFALLIRRLKNQNALAAAHAATRRFSAMSLVTVAILAGSGTVNACILVGGWHALLATPYGQLLIAKVALFAIAISIGARNLLVHKPRLPAAPMALNSITRNVWIEIALGSVVILLVAIMGILPPGSPTAG